MFLVWVVLFALHGFLRGTVAQVFVVLGFFAGFWAWVGVSGWLESHWIGTRSGLVYLVLRWIVAGLAALVVVAFISSWGEGLGRAVRSSPAAWLDRGGGLAAGAGVGLVTAAFVMMVVLLAPKPDGVAEKVANARTAAPLMATAAHACSLTARYLPGGPWLTERFRLAHRRAKDTRAEARAPRS